MQLSLSLLGSLSLKIDGNGVPASRMQKIEALLIYLVVESDRAHRRGDLMTLLFPDLTADSASTNLRQTLRRLRRVIRDETAVSPFLDITRETIGFDVASNFTCDLFEFKQRLQGCSQHAPQRAEMCHACMEQAKGAVHLYRGPFLTGLALVDSNAFETWAEEYREQLRRDVLAALHNLVLFHSRRGEYQQAIDFTRRLLAIEQLDEAGQQQLMRLLARTGQRTQALAQYDAFAKLLLAELAIEPQSDTKALRDQIVALPNMERRHQLPSRESHFVGRRAELSTIHAHFAAGESRLLTLLGGGGIGKTRLAIEAGWRIVADKLGPFMHGVYFVSLATLDDLPDIEKMLTLAIADSLGLSLLGVKTPLNVILGYLADKELLLIVDNCEEAGTAIQLLSQLLHQAPRLQILATSREPLNLSGEFRLRLEGLPLPTAVFSPLSEPQLPENSNMADYEAIALFAHHAQRVDGTFSLPALTQPEQTAVLRICQLCGGMPLALEMAAVWVSLLPYHEIAAEIGQNIDLLASHNRSHPDRHRTIRAVFDYSWERLSEVEQGLFEKLAVFRGSFGRQAARQVAQATWPLLKSLYDKSLVQFDKAADRYTLHPLLRQYAAEKLALTQELAAATAKEHAHFYCRWLGEQTAVLQGKGQQAALRAIALDFNNIRAAWQWATDYQAESLLEQAAAPLAEFCEMRGLFVEGEKLLAAATAQLRLVLKQEEEDKTAVVVAKLQARQGWLNFLNGRVDLAKKHIEEAIGLLRLLAHEAVLVVPVNQLAFINFCTDQYEQALRLNQEGRMLAQRNADLLGQANADRTRARLLQIKGNFVESLAMYEEALHGYRQLGYEQGTCWALLSISTTAGEMGNYARARTMAEEVIALSRKIKFQLVEGYALLGLGYNHAQQGEYEKAIEIFKEALQLGRLIRDRRQESRVLNWLGTCLRTVGKYEAARDCYEQALSIYRQMNNRFGEGLVLNDLGVLERIMGNYKASRSYHRQASKMGQAMGNQTLQRRVWSSLGHWYLDQERYGKARKAYQRVLETTAGLQLPQKLPPLSGLAYLAAKRGEIEAASEILGEIAVILESNQMDGADEPQRILWHIEQANMLCQMKEVGSVFEATSFI